VRYLHPISTTRSVDNASTSVFEVRFVQVGRQRLRVGVRAGRRGGTPLLFFNGIGANLELIEPFVAALHGVEVIAFDVPGIGGSPTPRLPYRLPGLVDLVDKMLHQLGYHGPVDVLGLSWGGAAAQQFARDRPDRCRRLVLAGASPGMFAVPGRMSVLSKLVDPRRYVDPLYMMRVGGHIYGGAYRDRPELLREHGRRTKPPRGRGYFFQLLALAGWTSVWWLPWVCQPALVMMGRDDPIVPPVNGRILTALMPNARLHMVDDGHLFLLALPQQTAPVVEAFLLAEAGARG
jgi:poly(3-hydroxyalkanoate) depolymerase